MNEDVLALTRALIFAARKHSDQRRKGAAAEPYVNHLAEVALLVAEATEGRDVEAVVAALLHDTLEDTRTTREELEREFGPEVAAVVAEVTDDKGLPKAERKRLQVEHAARKSDRAKLVKIADKTSNLRSILESPPLGWDRARRREYFEWSRRVVAGCRGVSPRLEGWFDSAYAAGMAGMERDAG